MKGNDSGQTGNCPFFVLVLLGGVLGNSLVNWLWDENQEMQTQCGGQISPFKKGEHVLVGMTTKGVVFEDQKTTCMVGVQIEEPADFLYLHANMLERYTPIPGKSPLLPP